MTVETQFKPDPLHYKTFGKDQLWSQEFGPKSKNQKIVGDPKKLAESWLAKFKDAVSSKDPDQVISLLAKDASIWRDLLGLQWEFRSLDGPSQIKDFLAEHLAKSELGNIELYEAPGAEPKLTSPIDEVEWLIVCFTFETKVGRGKGVVRLVSEEPDKDLKVFTVMTMLEELKGHEEAMSERRPRGVDHGQHSNRVSYAKRRAEEASYKDHNPQVVVVGGGQAALTVASRLRMMGVDVLIVEKNPRIGDNWRNRYEFLVLHDIVYYDHLPYIRFPETWPHFTPKDKLADFFEFYVKALDLNVWTGCTVTGAEFDKSTKKWTVNIDKADPEGGSSTSTVLHPNHVTQATGHSGEPNIPQLPGMDKFKGKIVHSSQHGSGAAWKGKKAVVVGSCNSALDISHDFWEQGADVTVFQRTSTAVVSLDSIAEIINKGKYCEGAPPVDNVDLVEHSLPNKIKLLVGKNDARRMAIHDKGILDALDSKGFKVDYGYGGTGFFGKYMIRGGGYYLDVGAVELIKNGSIKLKQGGEIVDFTENSIKFSDGLELEADIIVLATGYQNMKSTAKRVFGDKVAAQLGDAWGLNSEYELNHMWTDSGHPNYWYMGGNLALCRFYSKRLALRIVAEEAGLVQ